MAAKKANTAKRTKKATTRNVGRPSRFTPAVLDEICSRLSQGEPLAQICRDEHIPARQTVQDWTEADAEISGRIARAREAGEEWIAAECLRIADTPHEGVIEKFEPIVVKKDGVETTEFGLVERKVVDMIEHRKLQIDTRLKLLAKWNPRKWGEKLALSGDPDGAPLRVLYDVDFGGGK